MHYLAVLHVEEGKSGIGVTVPDLPAVSSAGDSFEEALANAAEAILVYLEVLAEDGHDLPVPREGFPSSSPGRCSRSSTSISRRWRSSRHAARRSGSTCRSPATRST